LYKIAPHSRTHRSRIGGFSMVELAVSMTVLLILTAIAIPSLMRSFRTYQLNDAASRFSDMLKFTRFEAVRRNTQINCQIRLIGTDWTVWTTPNGNTTPLSTEKQLIMAGFAAPLPAGGPPSPGAIATALGVSVAALNANTLSGANSTVTFDARGAIRVGGNISSNIFVFYFGGANDPEFGYRAVILLPAGGTQIWTAPQGGPWQRAS